MGFLHNLFGGPSQEITALHNATLKVGKANDKLDALGDLVSGLRNDPKRKASCGRKKP